MYILISFALIGLPLSFLKPKHFGYLVLLLFPFIVFESNHILLLKSPSSEEAIAAIILTNLNEISELIVGNIWGLVIVIALFTAIIMAVFNINKSFVLPRKLKTIIFSTFILTFLALAVRNLKLATKSSTKPSEIISSFQYSFQVQLSKNFPSGIFIKMKHVYEGLEVKSAYLKNTRHGFNFGFGVFPIPKRFI